MPEGLHGPRLSRELTATSGWRKNTGGSAWANVQVIKGDVLSAADVLRATHHQEAVVECVGGTVPWRNQSLEREAMQNIAVAMQETGARRLLVVSAMGVRESAQQAPWWYRYLLIPTFLRGSTADKTAMEAIVRGTQLDWTIARPPVLTQGAGTGKARVLENREVGHAITRADLATWLVEQLENPLYVRRAVGVVHG